MFDPLSAARSLSALRLASRLRILCWVMTTAASHLTKARHVKSSWGRHCDTLLFVSDYPGLYFVFAVDDQIFADELRQSQICRRFLLTTCGWGVKVCGAKRWARFSTFTTTSETTTIGSSRQTMTRNYCHITMVFIVIKHSKYLVLIFIYVFLKWRGLIYLLRIYI